VETADVSIQISSSNLFENDPRFQAKKVHSKRLLRTFSFTRIRPIEMTYSNEEMSDNPHFCFIEEERKLKKLKWKATLP
jgi:hypothetical protein